jgi:hypothetical protein
LATLKVAKENRLIDIEDGVALAIQREREYRLSGLHNLADFKTPRGNHTRSADAQLGVAKRVLCRPQLRLRRLEPAFRGSQSFPGLIVSDAGREAGRNEMGSAD